jgi:hypothetical protein
MPAVATLNFSSDPAHIFISENSMAFDLGGLLQQYLGGAANANPQQAETDFNHVAQNAPPDVLAQGVTEALRSDQTPPFSDMVGQLFGNGNSQQRAGMLTQLISTLGPGVLASLAAGPLRNIFQGNGAAPTATAAPTITAAQADQITPEQVKEIAAGAEKHDPGIVDKMGSFYAQHPDLVKGLGGAALAIMLGQMAQGMQRR